VATRLVLPVPWRLGETPRRAVGVRRAAGELVLELFERGNDAVTEFAEPGGSLRLAGLKVSGIDHHAGTIEPEARRRETEKPAPHRFSAAVRLEKSMRLSGRA